MKNNYTFIKKLLENYQKDKNSILQIPNRKGFGEGLLLAGKEDENVVALSADLTESTQVENFKKAYPNRYFEMGVAEQNMASVASGMAAMGKIPFITSYAMFSPGRNWEQIRTTLAYNNVPVKVVGCHAGVSVGPDGGTHQALEDIALMRVIPNMIVIVPADAVEAKKATMQIAKNNLPSYLRLSREKSAVITEEKSEFEIGKANVIYESKKSLQNKRDENKWPYMFKRKYQENLLYYFGESHKFDPEDEQWEKEKVFWSEFLQNTKGKKKIVFIEGGDWPVEINEKESIEKYGGMGLATHLANKEKIETFCPEPRQKEERIELLKFFTKEEIEYYYISRLIFQWQAQKDKVGFAKYVETFLAINKKESDWEDFEFTFENIKKIHKNIFGVEFNENDFDFFCNIDDPSKDFSIINKVSKKCGQIRDDFIVESIKKYLQNGYSIYLQFGGSHAERQEPEILKFTTGFIERVSQSIKKGKEVVKKVGIIACGEMVSRAIFCVKELESLGIEVGILNLHTIKPIDKVGVLEFVKKYQNILTCEEHQIAGGMGSAVLELWAEENVFGNPEFANLKIQMLGIQNRFGQSGTKEELFVEYELSEKDIIKAVEKF